MHLNTYQHEAAELAVYEDELYPVASLMVEAAELADIFVKPWLRGDVEDIDLDEVVSEAGDCLWMLSMILRDQGISLEEVARYNLKKLARRKKDGTIKGSGNR